MLTYGCFVLVACFATLANAYQPNSIWNNNRYDSSYTNNNAELFSNPSYNNYNPSSRLFLDKFGYNTNWVGSNQVGGSWWQQLANKFPFFNSKMEYPTYQQPYPYRPNVYSSNNYPSQVYPQQPNYQGYYPGVDVVGDTVSVSAPGFQGYSYPRPQYRKDSTSTLEDLK